MNTTLADRPNDLPASSDVPTPRLASIDVYRGAVMFLMMAEVLNLAKVARALPESSFWKTLAYHQTHVEWTGCSVHDMIQPSFSFLVGVALPFSILSRLRRGESSGKATFHAAWRSLVLIALGIFLRSIGRKQTYFTFEDTLTQIGLGYFPLFLIARSQVAVRWVAVGVILMGTWVAFEVYPAPSVDFNYSSVGVPADWSHHATGLGSHWNKNSHLAWSFDRWWLNQFPRESRFTHHKGGYATLSFVPTLATMLLGLIAGGWLQGQGGPGSKLGRMAVAGLVGIALGLALDRLGICPIVKRIWTPSWVLFSGGICFLVLATLYAALDLTGFSAWTYPVQVIGRNSIAAYCLAHLIEDFLESTFRTHLGVQTFRHWGEAYEPLLMGGAILATYWLILAWMDRRRIYLKV